MILQVGVKALIQNEKEQYLFLRRSQVVGDQTEITWDIPGGRIDAGEVLVDALKREIAEETGMILSGEPVLVAAQDIFVKKKDYHVVRLTYRVRAVGTVKLSDEHQELCWLSVDELGAINLDPYVHDILKIKK